MAYTTPRTWVTGETVTAAQMNANVRDNMVAVDAAVDSHASQHGDSGIDPIADADLTAVMMAGDLLNDLVLSGYDEVASVTTTSADTVWGTVTLAIPAGWTTWRCFAMATFGYNSFGVGSHHSVIEIDGTALQDQNVDAATDFITSGSVVAHRTGMTTTGNRDIKYRAWHTNAGSGVVSDLNFYAQAYRVN